MVRITAVGLVAGDGPGRVPGFEPRAEVPERKHLKLMAREVQLALGAIRRALAGRPGWESIPPERRGLFVGTSPAASDPADLIPAVGASRGPDGAFSVSDFGERGVPRVPPLWLVRGLSNNIVGFGSAAWDLRGANTTRCDGRAGGLAAVIDGARAIEEGRADLVVAGGADALVYADGWVDHPVGEAAAFFVLEAGDAPPHQRLSGLQIDGRPRQAGAAVDLGAASGVVQLARAWLAGATGVFTAGDPDGPSATVCLGPA